MSMLQRVVRLPKKSFDLVKNATVIDKRKLYATWEHIQLTKLLAYLDVDCVFDIGASQGEYAEMLRKKAAADSTGHCNTSVPIRKWSVEHDGTTKKTLVERGAEERDMEDVARG